MSLQSLLAKAGLRTATLGSLASLAVAFPLTEGSMDPTAHTAASRTGFYAVTGTSLSGVVNGTESLTLGPVGLAVGGAALSASTALATPASTTGVSSLRLPHGVAPTSPVNGDIWTTTAGMFAQINGSTVGPFGTGGGGGIGGSIATSQIAVGSGANTIAGASTLTATTTSGALIFAHAAGTYTSAVAVDFATHSGTLNSGSLNGTYRGLVSSLTLTPGGSTNVSTFVAGRDALTVSTSAANLYTTSTLIGRQVAVDFATTSTSGTTLSTLKGLNVVPTVNSSGGSGSVTITSFAGIDVQPTFTVGAGGTTVVTTAYGLFLRTPSAPGGGTLTLTTNYGIYQQDATARNLFAGIVGVGNATPSATTALITPASTTGVSSLRLPHGVAPSAPVDGDVWTTTAGMFAQINGSTVGPFGSGGGGTIGGSVATGQVAFGSGANTIQGSATLTYAATAGLVLAPTAVATGAQTALTLTGAANTNQTPGTEVNDVYLNLGRTVQWAAGAIANQRAVYVTPPTYAFVSASVISDADTLRIEGPPSGGANATLTQSCGLHIGTRAVSNVTSARALTLEAPSGGTTNWTQVNSGGTAGFAATTTSYASINLPHGTAPSAPVDGDLWTTTAGVFAQINGATVGPFGTGGGGGSIGGSIAVSQIAVGSGVNTISGSSALTFDTTNGFDIVLGATAITAPVGITGAINNYFEVGIQNGSSGTGASSDFVATADTGTSTTEYIDLGINGSGYTGGVFGAALEGYLYTSTQNLNIGTAAVGKTVNFLAGGTSTSTNLVLTLDSALATFDTLVTVTPPTTASDSIVLFNSTVVTTTAALTGVNYQAALYGFVDANGNLAAVTTAVSGVWGGVQIAPTGASSGTYNGVYGVVARSSDATTNTSGATLYGVNGVVGFGTTATAGTVGGSLFGVRGHFSMTNSAASGTATITSAGGLISAMTLSTTAGAATTVITNYFGLYIAALALGGSGTNTITNRYGIYQEDTASSNIFAGSAHAFGTTTTTANSLSHLGAAGIRTLRAATQDGIILLGRAGGTGNFFVTITPGTLANQVTLTSPLTSGTLTTGAGVSGQVAIWNGNNSLSGGATLTLSTVSGAAILTHGAGTSTATTTTFAANHSATFSGIFTTGPTAAVRGLATFSGATNTASVILAGGYFEVTATGAIANATSVAAKYSLLTMTPSGAVGSAPIYAGSHSRAVVTGAANTRFAVGNLTGVNAEAVFSTSNTSGAVVAASVIGVRVAPSVGSTNASGTNTVTTVFGVGVVPGTWTSSGGGGLTVTDYYGLFLGTVTLSTTTITNRYGVYQADPDANNVFVGQTTFGTTAAATGAWGIFAASTTADAALRIVSGVDPSAPADGDIWFDGTDLKMRVGGVTKTFTLV